MKRMRAFLIVPLVLLAAAQAQAQQVVLDRDIVYYSDKGNDLRLDIARPAAADQPVPAIIFLPIPTSKARATYAAQLTSAAQRGYVGVTLGYHYIELEDHGKARYPFPTQLLDVKRAIRWLRANADTYHVDAEKIGVIGWSYGGYLALMAGLTGPDDGLEPSPAGADTKVQAVVSLGGFIDWEKMDDSEAAWSLGGSAADIPEVYTKASPLSHASSDSPPVLLIYGKRDGIVTYDQAVALDRKLKEGGVAESLLLINEADHIDVSGYVDKEVVWRFFDQYLKPQGN